MELFSNKSKNLNVVVIQYDVILKNQNININKINMLFDLNTQLLKDIDLLVFPEMCLTGYEFIDTNDIFDFCDKIYYNISNNNSVENFKSLDYCLNYNTALELALKYDSNILFGFPEAKLNENLIQNINELSNIDYCNIKNYKFYNSVYYIDRKGKIINIIQKHFLYETDKSWSEEGRPFTNIKIINKNNKTINASIGICMDINQYEYKTDYNSFEFANFCKYKKSELIILIANWIMFTKECNKKYEIIKDKSKLNKIKLNRLYSTWNYWLDRLTPIIDDNYAYKEHKKHEYKDTDNVYFLVANRIGKECNTDYVGGSGIFKLRNELKLIKNLSYNEENIVIDKLYW